MLEDAKRELAEQELRHRQELANTIVARDELIAEQDWRIAAALEALAEQDKIIIRLDSLPQTAKQLRVRSIAERDDAPEQLKNQPKEVEQPEARLEGTTQPVEQPEPIDPLDTPGLDELKPLSGKQLSELYKKSPSWASKVSNAKLTELGWRRGGKKGAAEYFRL